MTKLICIKRHQHSVRIYALLFLSLFSILVNGKELKIAGDVNNDGLIHFADAEMPYVPADVTTTYEPLTFWINDDNDNLVLYESWPVVYPDSSNEIIDSMRDLEDFNRLHLLSDAWPSKEESAYLEFSLTPQSKSPELQIWLSADKSGSRGYLLEEQRAKEQMLLAGEALGRISEDKPLKILLDDRVLNNIHNNRLCFLFEATKNGTGNLQVKLVLSNKSVIISNDFHVSFRQIKTFYERVGVNWPEDIKAPWKYKLSQLPIPELTWNQEPMDVLFNKPWYEDNNIIVWVHGWIPQDDENYRRTLTFSFETMLKRFIHQGYKGRIVHFRWPTVKKQNFIGMQESEYRGYKTAPVLLDYINTLPSDKRIHVTTHSLGGSLVMEAVQLGLNAENTIFQVAAVPAEAFDDRKELLLDNSAQLNKKFNGYIINANTRIFNLFNPNDFTWSGWNLIQDQAKPFSSLVSKYHIENKNKENQKVFLKSYFFYKRPVLDKHEALALAIPSKSQALGGEGRVRGHVIESHNLHLEPYQYGEDHVAMWRWNPQQVMPYFNLMLDSFTIPYNSIEP